MKQLHHICLTGILGTLSVSRNVEHLDDYFRYKHCIKCVRIGRYSGAFFPQFGLNAERCGVSLRIQSECGKVRTRKLLICTLFRQWKKWTYHPSMARTWYLFHLQKQRWQAKAKTISYYYSKIKFILWIYCKDHYKGKIELNYNCL